MSQFGKAVVFNGGHGRERELAFVKSIDAGDKADLVVMTQQGIQHENDVPQRAPDEYGPEGGGRTWHHPA